MEENKGVIRKFITEMKVATHLAHDLIRTLQTGSKNVSYDIEVYEPDMDVHGAAKNETKTTIKLYQRFY